MGISDSRPSAGIPVSTSSRVDVRPSAGIPVSTTSLRDQMLSQIKSTKERDKMTQEWSEDNKNNYAGIRQFAKNISSQWFRESFCIDGFCGKGYNIEIIRKDFGNWIFFEAEYKKYETALLYAYWLFFSGMALVYAGETTKFVEKMKEKFSIEGKTSTSFIFFNFLKSYAQAKGISEGAENIEDNYYEKINEINKCINESKEDTEDVVSTAVTDKLEMIDDCIRTHLTKARTNEIISLAFPELEDKDEQSQKKALLSILRAGVAKFYFNQGKIGDCKKELDKAVELYPNNTLALIEFATLPLEKDSNIGWGESNKAALKNFKRIIKLIERENEYKDKHKKDDEKMYKGQFIDLPLLQVRIKFDANMELAHLYSKIGDYEKAEECYKKLQTELGRKKNHLTDSSYSQLESLLLLNRGRNCLDGEDYNSAVEYFDELLKKGDYVTREVRSIAYMNRGLAYYYAEDNFEKAKSELVKAIKLDPTNSHSYYNLGVLYYMEAGSIEKAKKFINKSLYRNIENVNNVDDKDYGKFKESLDRLSEVKNSNLGTGWWQWWFGTSKKIDGIRKRNILDKLIYFVSKYGRKITGIILLSAISALVIKLNYDLYLHDYLNLMINQPYTIHSHTVSNTDFILLGVNIAILLLPVISRLKIADVEIDIPIESKGNQIYQLMPLPNSVMRRHVDLNLDFGLFIVDLWY